MFGLNKKLSVKNLKEKFQKRSVKLKEEKQQSVIIPDLICKSFVEGCLVLACIHDIKNTELVVSLPGIGNFGYVKLNNISSIYSDLLKNSNEESEVRTLLQMYNKGDLVRCKVLTYENKKLYLTIEPNKINASLSFKYLDDGMVISGAVKTKEDHGFMIDLGVDNLTAFYKASDLQSLSIGQCCLFKIIKKASSRAINVKLCDQASESIFHDLNNKHQFDSYLPGVHLNACTVDKVGKTGLQVNISNQLIGYIHSNHVPHAKRAHLATKSDTLDPKKKPAFVNGDKLNATVIFINPYAKIVYLSLLSHLQDSTKHAKILDLFESKNNNESALRLGQIIDDVQVSMHTHKGLYVKFNSLNNKQCTGFIPKRHLFDTETKNEDGDDEDNDENESKEKSKRDAKNMKKEEIEKSFPLNSKLKARIYDFNLIEDLILLSSRESILNSAFMSYNELKVGQIVNCKIKKVNLENGGVNVSLSEFVSGFIPKIHTSDVPLGENILQRKFKVDGEIKCKIVQLNPSEKKCVLTAKKTLIKSKIPLISSYQNLKIGMETYGVVVSIQSYGLLLSFLNDVKGLLPRQHISTSALLKNPNQDLKELYYVGQLIKCKIFNFDTNKQQIKLSLIMDNNSIDNKIDEKEDQSQIKQIDLEYECGDLIEASTILQVNEEQGYFRLKLPRNGSRNGLVYKAHLSDFDSLNDALFDYYKQTKQINNLMVIKPANKSQKPSSCHYLTLKQTIIDFYTNLKEEENLAKSFEDLKQNTWFYGWIKKILDNGVLVELPNDLTGFASNKELKYLDELKSSNLNGLNSGQSVLVKISKLFSDKQRFTTHVKTRFDLIQKNSLDNDYMIELFKSYISNMKKIFSLNSAGSQPNVPNLWYRNAFKIQIGSKCKVAVKSFNQSSGQLECIFMNDLDESINFNNNVIGYAFVNSDETDLKHYSVGSKFEALVVGFDPIARAFCLTISKKDMKIYAKNFDSKFQKQTQCKINQSIKATVIYVSQWFCILGLKAHGLGRLAIMPLFRNDFTQLNTFNSIKSTDKFNNYEVVDSKIKQKQVLAVSSASISSIAFNSISDEQNEKIKEVKTAKLNKQDKRFSYFYVGQMIKVIVKSSDEIENMDYLLVIHDNSSLKRNKKKLLRQLAILNETHENSTSILKRKLEGNANGDEPIILKKKLIIKDDNSLKNRKRKLSETTSSANITEDNKENKEDYIEIVSNVKQSDNAKKQMPLELISNEINLVDLFKMDINDFEQFDALVNETNGTEEPSSKSKKSKITKSKEKENKNGTTKDNDEEEFESVEKYEELVTKNPNSSVQWIKYMNFFLKMAETEKARGVALRALKNIFYREDSEKLNMWIALLNFDCIYGTQEMLDDSFNKATQNCDSYKIHCHMTEIYIKAQKLEEAEAVFVKMTRKFSKMPDVWIRYGIFHYRNSNCELARKLLIKSFNSLDKADHVEMVNKFAQLEFKYGDIERAKTMYDTLLFTYQNRTDIWSVYIDMLIKHQKYDDVRHVFNRIIQMGLTVKRMKFIFKKYIDFETAHGTDETVELVKESAVKYAEKNEFNDNKKPQIQKEDHSNSVEKSLKKNLNI